MATALYPCFRLLFKGIIRKGKNNAEPYANPNLQDLSTSKKERKERRNERKYMYS